MASPVPFNEAFRVDALYGCNILEMKSHPEIDTIVSRVATEFGVPIAFVSLLDADKQVLFSRVGPLPATTSRNDAVCSFAIMSSDPMIVPDLSIDPRFEENPYVVGFPGLRFYAGFPLILRDGFRVGTLCICDTEPRPFLEKSEIERLSAAADRVAGILEERRHGADSTDLGNAKDAFLAAISLELRTPLNAIIGFCQLIEMKSTDPTAVEYSGYALKSSEHLLGMVKRILTFVELEAGNIDLSEARVPWGTILEPSIATVLPEAEKSGIDLTSQTAVERTEITVDPEHARAAIVELLAAAVKLANRTVDVRSDLNEMGEMVLSVDYDGAEVDPKVIQQALDPLLGGKSAYVNTTFEVYSELALANKLIGLHGGRVNFGASDGLGGGRIYLHFPCWRVAARV